MLRLGPLRPRPGREVERGALRLGGRDARPGRSEAARSSSPAPSSAAAARETSWAALGVGGRRRRSRRSSASDSSTEAASSPRSSQIGGDAGAPLEHPAPVRDAPVGGGDLRGPPGGGERPGRSPSAAAGLGEAGQRDAVGRIGRQAGLVGAGGGAGTAGGEEEVGAGPVAGRGLARDRGGAERQDGLGGVDVALGPGERGAKRALVERPGLEGRPHGLPVPDGLARLGEGRGGGRRDGRPGPDPEERRRPAPGRPRRGRVDRRRGALRGSALPPRRRGRRGRRRGGRGPPPARRRARPLGRLGGAEEQVALAGRGRRPRSRADAAATEQEPGPAAAGADLLRAGDQPVEGAARGRGRSGSATRGPGASCGRCSRSRSSDFTASGRSPASSASSASAVSRSASAAGSRVAPAWARSTLCRSSASPHRPAGVQQAGQQLAREADVSGPLVGAPGGPQRRRPVALLPREQRRVAEGAGRRGALGGAAGEGLERLAPGKASDRRWRGAAQGGVLVGEGAVGGEAAEGVAEAGVGLGEARRRRPASRARSSSRSPAVAGSRTASLSSRSMTAASSPARRAQARQASVVPGSRGRERARLLGVDPRRDGIAGGEVERGEAQEQRGALAGGGGRHEPGERLPLRRVVAGRRGPRRRAPARPRGRRPGPGRRRARRAAPPRPPGTRPAAIAAWPARASRSARSGSAPGGGLPAAASMARAWSAGRTQDAPAPRSSLQVEWTSPDASGRGHPEGASAAARTLVRARSAPGGAPVEATTRRRSAQGIDRNGDVPAPGSKGEGSAATSSSRSTRASPAPIGPAPQPHGHAPPLEPELEAGRGGDAVCSRGLGHGWAILPWIGPPRGNRLLLLGDLGRLGCDAR